MSASKKSSISPQKKNSKEKRNSLPDKSIEIQNERVSDRSKDFIRELEFVQLLCNPEYLKWLYGEKYFSDSNFRNFLKYLMYFKKPEYQKFLIYPQCIPILEILLDDNVGDFLSEDAFYTRLSDVQYSIWKHRY